MWHPVCVPCWRPHSVLVPVASTLVNVVGSDRTSIHLLQRDDVASSPLSLGRLHRGIRSLGLALPASASQGTTAVVNVPGDDGEGVTGPVQGISGLPGRSRPRRGPSTGEPNEGCHHSESPVAPIIHLHRLMRFTFLCDTAVTPSAVLGRPSVLGIPCHGLSTILENELLPKVEKPSRYLGMINAVQKPQARVRLALAFPDLYDIGPRTSGCTSSTPSSTASGNRLSASTLPLRIWRPSFGSVTSRSSPSRARTASTSSTGSASHFSPSSRSRTS